MSERSEAHAGFTMGQWNALIALRADYAQGEDPPRSRRSFEERYGVTLLLQPADAFVPPRHWKCLLERQGDDGFRYRLVTTFCVVPDRPDPPTLREVVQGLAIGAAHHLVVPDLAPWAALYRINRSGQTAAPCYRGLVRRSATDADFVNALAREHVVLEAFLGPTGFAELMSLVGVDADMIESAFTDPAS